MKDSTKITISFFVLLALLGYALHDLSVARMKDLHRIEMQRLRDSIANVKSDTVYLKDDWSKLLEAIIITESGGNPRAIGKANDVGCMQIRPIYVREVNRILKEERYTLDDRYDPMKSLEMFHVVQGYHNPNHDIEKAIKLHNRADWYREKIINTMQEI